MASSKSTKDGSPLTKRRAADNDGDLLQRGFRRTMKRKPEGSKLCWSEHVAESLCDIVRDAEVSPRLRLQAIHTALQINGGQPAEPAMAPAEEPEELSASRDPLRPTPEEEALSDEELDRQIAELQNCLGSVSTGSA